ncbi:MAG: ftsE [Paucimonas sp.]|jgi:cell division transport system ATP-binding protein|nr:ftsE [Paucimonas sp.]
MIDFKHVSKQYSHGVTALSDVNLSVTKGELIYLAGPSGAGKSTILKLIAAMERPSGGSVQVNGQDIGKLKRSGLPYLRRNLGLILQQQRLLDDRSVLANVMLPLQITGSTNSEAEKRARAALDKVGLLDKAAAMPVALSGGEQQRVSIARAIVNRPQIILADEPTANLDRASATRVMDAITAFHAVGVTCVISSHDEQILGRASRVVYLNQGRVVDGWRDDAPKGQA